MEGFYQSSYEEEQTDAEGVSSEIKDENRIDLRGLLTRPTYVSCCGTETEKKIDNCFDKIRDASIRSHCKSDDEAREKIDAFQCSPCSPWRAFFEFYKRAVSELFRLYVKSDTFESFTEFMDGDTQQKRSLREQLEAER